MPESRSPAWQGSSQTSHSRRSTPTATLTIASVTEHWSRNEHLRWDGEEQQREVTAELRTSNRELAQQVAHSRIVQPGRLLDYQAQLDLGERTVTLVHPGRGHTDNDVVVWIAEERVLFAGDLVEEGGPPSFEDSFPLEWPDSLATILALGPDRIVPGHGAVVDANFVRRQHDDLQQLAEIAQQGFKNTRRPAEIDAQSAFPGRPAQTAIRRAYGQLTAASTGVWTERQPG
jgi:glyoxylase-like metal-dependent hydrolase (beta-lactamase superfamily II)